MPDPYLGLTDEDIREFQRIVEKTRGVRLTFEEARRQAVELLDLFYLLHDPVGWEQHRKDLLEGYGLPRIAHLDPPKPVPVPQPAPINLRVDHHREIERGLAMTKDELHWVRARPTIWRYAVDPLPFCER